MATNRTCQGETALAAPEPAPTTRRALKRSVITTPRIPTRYRRLRGGRRWVWVMRLLILLRGGSSTLSTKVAAAVVLCASALHCPRGELCGQRAELQPEYEYGPASSAPVGLPAPPTAQQAQLGLLHLMSENCSHGLSEPSCPRPQPSPRPLVGSPARAVRPAGPARPARAVRPAQRFVQLCQIVWWRPVSPRA